MADIPRPLFETRIVRPPATKNAPPQAEVRSVSIHALILAPVPPPPATLMGQACL